MTRKMTALLILSSLVLAAPVAAATKPDGASFTIDGGAVLYDHDLKLETAGPSVGARLGYDFNKWFGVEGRFSYVDNRSTATASKPQVYGFTYHVDALGYLLPDSRFVPYVAAGVGGMSLRNPDTFGDQDSLLLNYGLGAKFFVLDSLALRVDARHLLTFDNNQHGHGEFTFGVNYYFGGAGNAAQAAVSPASAPQAEVVAKPAVTVSSSAVVVHEPIATPAVEKKAEPAPVAAAPAAPAVVAVVAPAAPAAPVVVEAPAARPAPVDTPAPVAEAKKEALAAPEKVVPSNAAEAATAGHVGMLVDAAEVKPAKAAKAQAKAPVHRIPNKITAITKVDNGVRISTSRDVKDFRVTALSKPNRLAIDVYSGVNATGKQKIAMNGGGISGVRVADYPNKARVVLDLSGSLPRYRVLRTPSGLELVFDTTTGK